MVTPSNAGARADGAELEDIKADLRTAARAARNQRSPQRREEAAIAIASHVLGMPQVRDAATVSVYTSRVAEPGTMPLIEALADRGVRVLLPLLGDGLQRGWGVFHGADDLTERAPGRPPEPSGDFLPGEALAEADVVIVPALAADSSGTRLGQGGGWYDRALVHSRPGAPIVALVFEDEMCAPGDPLPREDHDVPVDVVVTPSGITVIDAASAT